MKNMTMTNAELYNLLDVCCERCGDKIEFEPEIIFLDAPEEANGERAAFFCDEYCLDKWFNEPGNPCTHEEEENKPTPW